MGSVPRSFPVPHQSRLLLLRLSSRTLSSPLCHSIYVMTDTTKTATTSSSLPAIIPLADNKRGRTLVLCFDGTGDQFDADVSRLSLCSVFNV